MENPTLGTLRADPARSRAAAGKDPEREGGRDGRAGDAPLDRASTTEGVWTRAVTSPRLDRPHQLDGAGPWPCRLAAKLDRVHDGALPESSPSDRSRERRCRATEATSGILKHAGTCPPCVVL